MYVVTSASQEWQRLYTINRSMHSLYCINASMPLTSPTPANQTTYPNKQEV